MRLLFLFMGCCLTLTCLAQQPQRTLRIQLSYENADQRLEQAVETIVATGRVGKTASVEYRAGQSVTMLPGFEAQQGSTFLAQIKAVQVNGEPSLQLAAFPNPFEQSTTINYYLPAEGKVNLWVTDAQGKVVGQLLRDENQSAGQHTMEWKPTSLSDGVYIPVIEVNQQRAVSRIVKK
ncbi:T9SS type A sorting domain-containing protein [Spirosoma spitsbergense]|uniref:T9SS type A sorting domain-containing protein n=1 Tax=Spirosoma spitsbergense TaxID=431554 RepID=UPI00037C50B8|nr:T9SS type A sorting domain-containing protein [Spirosoma spitsbergense]